jgi:3-oxoacyl-[acyl-carrier-protein] synthase III
VFYLERLGAFVPDTTVSVEHLGGLVGLTASQIHFYTRFLGLDQIATAPGVDLADMLSAAGGQALHGVDRGDVRFLLHAHTGQHAAPPSWHLLEQVRSSLGLRNASALGVSHQNCVIGLYAFQLARYLLYDAQPQEKALIVIGEKVLGPSSYLIPDTTVMGEAAAAYLVGRSPGGDRIIGQATRILGRFYQGLGGSDDLKAEYKTVYLDTLTQVMRQALARSAVEASDLVAVLPHNVNRMSWKRVARELGVPADRIYLDNVAKLGHCYGADPIINLVTARAAGRVGPGDLVLLASAGLGASFGAAVVRLGLNPECPTLSPKEQSS